MDIHNSQVIMDIKEQNIKIFQDTMHRIDTSKTLTESVEYSIANQVFYSDNSALETYELVKSRILNFDEPAKIVVTKNSTFNAARNYNGKVCVLNFASATNPGGGVDKGATAQEECLCRTSTLYKCLNTPGVKEVFYIPHRKSGTPLHNDDILYTPDVTIIKSDNYNSLFMHKKVNVITCAAPNLRITPANAYNHENGEGVKISDEDLFKLHVERAHKILACAAIYNNETVILGAFGCGAFKNPPEIVAEAYKKVISEYFMHTFKTIEFAVYCRSDMTNYEIFNKILG